MKKLFLILTMFLFAFTGITRAEEVEIGAGTTSTTSYFPTYANYNYSIGQQIYTAEQIGTSGYLAAISFNVSANSAVRHIKIYLKEVDYSAFASTTAWETFEEDAYYFDGDVEFTPGWVRIMLDNSFNYSGEGNLLICVVDETGSWVSSYPKFIAWNEDIEYCRMHNYNDNNPYDVTNPGVTGSRSKWKNNVKLLFMGEPQLELSPLAIDFGYRPRGYWMEPAEVTITNLGAITNVTTVATTNNFFATDATVPFAVPFAEEVKVNVTTSTGVEGVQEGQLVVAHAGGAALVDLTATAYTAVEGDVYEIAKEVEAFPYQDITTTENLYKNYNLPGMNAEAVDAVYKVTFDEPVLFNAGTNGQKPTTVLYTEDFYGEEGPMSTNNYDYNGPSINPGPVAMWFNYEATGTYTFFGSQTGGGMYFGYKIAAEYLQGLSLGSTSLLSVESAAYGDYPYNLIVVRGGNTPSNGDLIYAQAMVGTPGEYSYFTMDIDQPFVVGDEEAIWVLFYSESPYAAYCQRNPIDTENGKIWYSMDGSSWSSNVLYTPQIYCYFRTVLGRDLVMDLSDMSIKEINGNGTMEEANAQVNGVSKAQLYAQAQQMKADRNRDAIIIEQDFEDGMGDWTMNNCHSSTGRNINYTTHSGDVLFRFYYTSNYPQYLISPELDDNNGGTLSFFYACYSSGYPETFKVGFSSTTNDPSDFTWEGEVICTNENEISYLEYNCDVPAGTKYIAIACTSDDQFYFFVDDITIELQSAGPAPAKYQIENMYVPAGTYYVAVASTTENFQVDMFTEEAPAPVQAFLYDPIDGDTGIEEGYIMQWVLGDYTEEVQVLLGTTYPPTTPLIDWTDYLVESMFLENIQNNKTYFVQVNARNAVGTTYGEIIGFTTLIDPVEGFTCDDPNLYPGQSAHFTWDANRSIKGYNMYMDGVKLNETPITETEFTSVSDLAYNMDGYMFQVSAVYDEGESALSEPIAVRMTGFGSVNGHVWEQDSITPVALANVEMRGIDEYGVEQTFSFPTNPSGYYEGEVLAGLYIPTLVKEGYQESEGEITLIAYNELTADADIVCYEIYYPLQQIVATEEENDVLVEWSWTPAAMVVDFETGDLSQADFTLPAQYPWTVTTTNPYEGTYGIKSTCEGVASGVSSIEATVDVPFDGKMGFWVRVSSEANYDKFHFYIDGVEQGSALSGNLAYQYKEYVVAEGLHTYKWEYAKDSSVNSNDDCVYVDYITMYMQDIPVPPTPGAQTFSFEGGLEGWTLIDNDNDGHNWYHSTEASSHSTLAVTSHTGDGHVMGESYCNATYAALTPDDYMVAPTMISAHNGAMISFWACAQDVNYPSEHFGVAVSTTTATAAAFTTIQEWTLTAKKGASAVETTGAVRGDGKEGAWYQFSADLSSYAGQDIWVAIRHFNCSDMFIINVDDVEINDGSVTRGGGDRMLQSYKLYRRDINGTVDPNEAEAELIATLSQDVYSYVDNSWPSLSYGVYQWGIAAYYEGNQHPLRAQLVIDFETGDFSQYDFVNDALYPWTVVAENNSYVMKSGNSGIASSSSAISATVEFVSDGTVSFDALCMGEGTSTAWDKCIFEIDGEQQFAYGAWITGWNNYSFPVAAGTHTFTWKYTKDSSVNPDGDFMAVDNITFDGVAGGGGSSVSTMSEILWSNIIEKDMYSTVVANIALNNAQSPEGAVVTLSGEDVYTATADETGIVVFEGVRKGVYDITVELDGYNSEMIEEELIDQDFVSFDFILEEQIIDVMNLYTSATGWAMWNGEAIVPGGGEVTVADGTSTNSYVPVYGLWVDSYTRSETVYPADMLSSINGGAITSITYYISTPATAAWSPAVFNVYMKEVSSTTLSEYYTSTGATVVYTGALDATGTEMTINFTTPYTYQGGNLLVGIEETTTGTYKTAYFYGEDVTGCSASGYNSSSVASASFNQRNFMPKTTFSCGSKGDRAPIKYKVMLDGTFVEETFDTYYQFDVEDMVEGEEHVTGVAALYATGMSDYSYYTWTYVPCDNFAGMLNYDVTVDGNDALVTFTLPGSGPTPTPPTPPTPPTGDVTVVLQADDVWGDGSGYQMLLDDTHSLYGTTIPTTGALSLNCSGNEAIYAQFSHKIPTNADGNCSTQNMVNNSSVSITIPAGTYDWCIVNPTPGDRLWIASSGGNIGGRYDDFTFEAGNTYTFHVYFGGSNDATDLTVTPSKSIMPKMDVNTESKSIDDVVISRGRDVVYEAHFVTDPGAMNNGGDASWLKASQSTYGPGAQNASGNMVADEFTLTEATTITEIEVYGYQTGSTTTSTFTGMYATIYDGSPASGGQIVWGDMNTNIMTSTSFTNAYRGSNNDASGTTRPIMALTASNLNIALPAGTYYLVWNLAGSGSSGPWAQPEALPEVGSTGNGIQYLASQGTWANLTDSGAGTTYGVAFKITANGSGPVPPTPPTGDVLGAFVFVDGMLVTPTPVASPVLVEDLEEGEHIICVRVVYNDYTMSCYECEIVEIGEVTCDPVTNLEGMETEYQGEPAILLSWEGEALSYNIYYGTALLGNTPELGVYITGVPVGEYTFGITAVYDNCESDPMYVTVVVDGVNEDAVVNAIYPNPTSGDLHINATAMTRVSVFNTMGQMVYDQNVSCDEMVLDMSQFEAGVYMVNIVTENGTSVKRITVVK